MENDKSLRSIYGNLFLKRPFPQDLENVKKIHDFIKATEQPTKRLISEKLELKPSTVNNCINHLMSGGYITTTRSYSPPFLKVTNVDGTVEAWVYGKDNRLHRCEIEKEKIYISIEENNLSNTFAPQIKSLEATQTGSPQFLEVYKTIFEDLKKRGISEICSLEVGTPAYRFQIPN